METILTFLLLFFFLFFFASYSSSVPEPKQSAKPPEPYDTELVSRGGAFEFRVNGRAEWQAPIPDPFDFRTDRIVPKNPCSGFKNMERVEAAGQTLYEFLQENPLHYPDAFKFQKNDTPLGVGNVFYFTCRNQEIHTLSMCPSGQVFREGECRAIHACTGLPDGAVMPDASRRVTFYRVCENGVPVSKECEKDTFFLYDSCRPMKDFIHYCDFFQEPHLLNESTRIECRNGKIHFKTCGPGFRFFEVSHCEPDTCANQPDGAKRALPKETFGPFAFSPGYVECRGGRIVQTVSCPKRWDSILSKGDNLTHLPMVFDSDVSECVVPTFCTNVTSVDPHVLVPVHEFQKHVANWKHAGLFDSTTGYTCEGSVKRRVSVNPGEWIHPKRFKREYACLPPNPKDFKVPVSGKPKEYFDCSKKMHMQCQARHHFDGSDCVSSLDKAFEYNDIGFFRLGPLSFDDWIQAWSYSQIKKNPVCQPPESELLSIYGVCSHPDCTKYPFLSQLPPFPVLLQDGRSKCTFDRVERKLVKEPVDVAYDFWTQREFSGTRPSEPCVPGEKLKTGHFVWDSVLYKTCLEEQPFIFCPSSVHQGIVRVGINQYACKPPPQNKVPLEKRSDFVPFQNKEIRRITPIETGLQNVVNVSEGHSVFLHDDGLDISNADKIRIRVQRPVHLEYQYRVTYPPYVVFKDGTAEVGMKNKSYIVKNAGYTDKRLDFANYDVESGMAGFETIA